MGHDAFSAPPETKGTFRHRLLGRVVPTGTPLIPRLSLRLLLLKLPVLSSYSSALKYPGTSSHLQNRLQPGILNTLSPVVSPVSHTVTPQHPCQSSLVSPKDSLLARLPVRPPAHPLTCLSSPSSSETSSRAHDRQPTTSLEVGTKHHGLHPSCSLARSQDSKHQEQLRGGAVTTEPGGHQLSLHRQLHNTRLADCGSAPWTSTGPQPTTTVPCGERYPRTHKRIYAPYA